RRPYLAPRALFRILVVTEADELRAVAEAVALDLVVPDLGHELGTHSRLGQLAGAPAVRFREAAVRRVLQQRLDAPEDLLVTTRGDCCRADVVDLAVVVIEAEQQSCDARGLLLPTDADDHAVR